MVSRWEDTCNGGNSRSLMFRAYVITPTLYSQEIPSDIRVPKSFRSSYSRPQRHIFPRMSFSVLDEVINQLNRPRACVRVVSPLSYAFAVAFAVAIAFAVPAPALVRFRFAVKAPLRFVAADAAVPFAVVSRVARAVVSRVPRAVARVARFAVRGTLSTR